MNREDSFKRTYGVLEVVDFEKMMERIEEDEVKNAEYAKCPWMLDEEYDVTPEYELTEADYELIDALCSCPLDEEYEDMDFEDMHVVLGGKGYED
jgi:hypothetical protein